MRIGKEEIGRRPFFIADIASNHDGSLERAYMLIELAKEAGADVAKFQNFRAHTIVSDYGFKNMGEKVSHQATWEKTVYEVYKDATVPDEWTERLKEKCDEIGIEYMTSPYDFAAVDKAFSYVNAYKIGSGDITWTDMLEYIAKKGKPVILATGASEQSDVERAMEVLERTTKDIILMQCNTNYTGNKENFKNINLNVLKMYKEKYPECILGLSDHTKGYATVLGALALGATVFEKHFTDDVERSGPDHKFSVNPKEWKEMVEQANYLYQALGDGIKRIEKNEQESVLVQRRAVYALRDIEIGEIIKSEDVIPLRPVKKGAVLPYELKSIYGKSVKKKILKDSCIMWEDIRP